jgi:hypothetical protein
MDRLEGLFDEIEFSIFLFSKFVVIINTSWGNFQEFIELLMVQ